MKSKSTQELVKMAHIIVIQMLKKSIDNKPYTYESLESKPTEELSDLRDELIISYNQAIEDRKFVAEMIYDRRKK